MSILDDVRRKYRVGNDPFDSNGSLTDSHLNTSQTVPASIQTATDRTDKTDISPFGGNGSPLHKHLSTSDPAIMDAIAIVEMRERGIVPDHYTATTECARCGPVPIWPGLPAKVLGCPWCFNRQAGIPIPTIESAP